MIGFVFSDEGEAQTFFGNVEKKKSGSNCAQRSFSLVPWSSI